MKIRFSERAKKDFARLPKRMQKKVRQAIIAYGEGKGNIDLKKIKTTRSLHRIAVDEWRIFIYREIDELRYITNLEQRKDAYR